MKRILPSVSTCIGGVVICSAAAVGAAIFSAQRPWRLFVPLAFVFVIVFVGARFGVIASVIAAVATAFVFAYFMFPPHHSFRVASSAERANLAWMLLAGVAISYLVAAPGGQQQHRK